MKKKIFRCVHERGFIDFETEEAALAFIADADFVLSLPVEIEIDIEEVE